MTQDFFHDQMEYGKDENGKEILLKDGKFQVMMEWEKPYMKACIDVLRPSGDVLEVGFGLGYSSQQIQGYSPKSHTIIEYHPKVAERARKWAKRYPNVTIIEETWQNALPNLGLFDSIFFDDYPLQSEQEMRNLQEIREQSQWLLKKAEQIHQEVHQTLPFLKEIKYSDEDLRELMKNIPLEQKMQTQQFVRFLNELFNHHQMTCQQLQEILDSLVQEKKMSKEEINAILKTPEKKEVAKPNERLFIFLNQCLASHMRKNARFSCFLSSPVSKYQDEKFVSEIIVNPSLDYHEEEIAVEVPENCNYFSGNKALVITITKRV